MSIVASCGCGRQFQAPDKLAGKNVRCPGCGGVIQVPIQAAVNLPPVLNPDLSELKLASAPMPSYPPGPSSPPSPMLSAALQPNMAPSRPYSYGAGWSRRRQKQLAGWLVVAVMGAGVCVLAVTLGYFALVKGMRYNPQFDKAAYASLNSQLARFVDPPGLQGGPESGEVAIRGKYVLIDKDAGQIHRFHDGADADMAWKAEEVDTVIWLESKMQVVGVYRKEDEKGEDPRLDRKATAEVVTATVIDLGQNRKLGTFQCEAKPSNEILAFEVGKSYVDRDDFQKMVASLKINGGGN